jgi:hypothetical protein
MDRIGQQDDGVERGAREAAGNTLAIIDVGGLGALDAMNARPVESAR